MISRLKVKSLVLLQLFSLKASRSDLVIDLESSADFNCYYSWDNVSEDTVEINGTVTSNVINFDNKVLTDYTKSITNRNLRIDDFSDIFNSNQRLEQFSIVASYPSSHIYNKVIILLPTKSSE